MMRTRFKFYFKSAWVMLWLLLFASYHLGHVSLSPGVHLIPYSWCAWLAPLMFLASFPASLMYVMFIQETGVYHGYAGAIENNPLFWMGLFAVGTLQWFKLIPYMLRDRKITKLNLSTANSQACIDGGAPPAPRVAQATRGFEHPVSHFDERGRSPLERVLEDEAR